MYHASGKNIQIYGKMDFMTFKHCQHVYRNVDQNPCPFCGGETHEVDWNRNRQEMADHREKYGLFNTIGTWWSI